MAEEGLEGIAQWAKKSPKLSHLFKFFASEASLFNLKLCIGGNMNDSFLVIFSHCVLAYEAQ